MLITKKNQYAMRAVFELAKHWQKGPIKIAGIARNQSIPIRFLEQILVELKHGGFLRSKRGYTGGYELIIAPDALTVGDLMRFLSRNEKSVECMAPIPETTCPFQGRCSFFPMWDKVKQAIFDVYDQTSFQNLLDVKVADGRYPLDLQDLIGL